MTTETKILGIVLVLTVALLLGGVFFLSRGGSPQGVTGTTVSQIEYAKGQKIGSDSAKAKLVEFSDFQCPACKSAEPAIKQVLSKYPDNLQFIYRHFPLPQHTHAKKAATLAEAAGEGGKFWEMHDKIFETQSQWSNLSDTDATAFFLGLARDLNLDEAEIREALEKNTFKSKIEDDITEARSLGANSTPTFFLNGKKLNLKSFNDLDTAIESELTF